MMSRNHPGNWLFSGAFQPPRCQNCAMVKPVPVGVVAETCDVETARRQLEFL